MPVQMSGAVERARIRTWLEYAQQCASAERASWKLRARSRAHFDRVFCASRSHAGRAKSGCVCSFLPAHASTANDCEWLRTDCVRRSTKPCPRRAETAICCLEKVVESKFHVQVELSSLVQIPL
jgi:hypothetical protein